MYKPYRGELEKKFRNNLDVRLEENELLSDKYSGRTFVPYIFMLNIVGCSQPWVPIIAANLSLGPSHYIFRDVKLTKKADNHNPAHIEIYFRLCIESMIKSASSLDREKLFIYTDDLTFLEVLMDYGFRVGVSKSSEFCKYKAGKQLSKE